MGIVCTVPSVATFLFLIKVYFFLGLFIFRCCAVQVCGRVVLTEAQKKTKQKTKQNLDLGDTNFSHGHRSTLKRRICSCTRSHRSTLKRRSALQSV